MVISHFMAVLPRTTKSQAEQFDPEQDTKPFSGSRVPSALTGSLFSCAYVTCAKKMVARVRMVRRCFIGCNNDITETLKKAAYVLFYCHSSKE
jgi:hypothetical protein